MISFVQDVSLSVPSDRVPVRHVLVHSRSYLGGEYGRRGGYDLTLLSCFQGEPFLSFSSSGHQQRILMPREAKIGGRKELTP